MTATWILRISCLLQLASMGILFSFEAVRMKDMGIGESAIGYILATSSGIFIFSSLIWGKLADKKHCHKQILTWGTVGFCALLIYFSYCATTLQFFAYAIVRSILMPMIGGIMPAIAVTAFGKNNKGKGSQFGVYRAFGSLGYILGTMGLPLIFNDIGIAARCASLLLLSSLLLVRKFPEPEDKQTKKEPLRIQELDPRLKLFLISFFFISIGEPSVHGFFTAYARELGGSTRLIGTFSGCQGFIAFLFLPLMGRLVDKVSPALILSVAFLAQPLRIFITSFISDPQFLWTPILLHGICWGGIEVSAVVYLSNLVKENQKATVLSFYLAMRMLGNLAGSSISGIIAEDIGYTSMFRTTAAVTAFGAFLYIAGSYLFSKKATQAR